MMRRLTRALALSLLGASTAAAQAPVQRPWQRLSTPTVAELAAHFAEPPSEYGASVTWGWNAITTEAIARDLDDLKARGFRVVTIEAGYRMPAPYLSDGWFDLIGTAVREAARRDMRVWLIDEGKYPSGFADGKFSRERPDLRMQGLVIGERIAVAPGASVSRQLSDDVLSAAAVNLDDGSGVPVDVSSHALAWSAPSGGRWELWLARHVFKTSPTRAASNATGGKDTTNSLFDYLNADGTRQFIAFTHEQYRRRLGAEFGKTILGFRGDEPDYGHTPWTPRLLDEFTRRKGYDVRPYLAAFFARAPSDSVRRAKADYWDVWSAMFGENFFGVQAAWAAEHDVEHMTHLNHEEKAQLLVRSEGDYFRDMRRVQIPGVDVIWNQVWPDSAPVSFEKLASSAAHLFGRPRALSESFAAFNPAPTIAQAKWVIDHELVRGINAFELMFYISSAGRTRPIGGYMGDSTFPSVNRYTHRMSYLLAQGRPSARIAVYYPTTSLWLGDAMADSSNLSIAQQLMEQQRDFDWIDETSLTSDSVLTSNGATLRGLSGQRYGAVIVPTVTVMSRAAIERLRAFAKAGGRVLFLGRTPSMTVDRTYLGAGGAPDVSWATLEPSGRITAAVDAALPPRDVALDAPSDALRYNHRTLADGELYFLFNEGKTRIARTVTLEGGGRVQAWDALAARVSDVASARVGASAVRVPLVLAPWETRVLVVRRR